MATAAFDFATEQFVFRVAGVGQRLAVVDFEGDESISEFFRFRISLVSDSHTLCMSDVVGSACRLDVYDLGGQHCRHVSGVVTRFEQGEVGRRLTHYCVDVEPQLKLLALGKDCRIFQNLTVPEIVRSVLVGAGIPSDRFRFACGDYQTREYCVQYRESDLNFICRLLEDEGILFFFEHYADGEVLVIADDASIHRVIDGHPQLHCHDGDGLIPDDHISHLRFGQAVVPGKVTLRDYNFKQPGLDLQVEQTAEDHTELEVYDYPGKYEEPGLGDVRRRVLLEAIQAERVGATGVSNCRRLVPGRIFELTEHQRRDFNQRYLLTRVGHSGEQGSSLEEDAVSMPNAYSCQFTCMPADRPFRAARHARRPIVEGVQTAVVVGPEGEEIYTDEFGRVKVQFPWDREGEHDENSSCWIRVSQGWAGAGWGGMSIPRIGQEVIVDFLEGDPDRPIITGRVYHGENRPPYPLPEGKAKMTIMSDTTKGGGGSNELRFDDTKDSEELYIHAQKDATIATENDKSQTVGRNESLSVASNRTKSVGANQSASIGRDDKVTVGVNRTTEIGANDSQRVNVNRDVTIGANLSEKVGLNRTDVIGANMAVSVGGTKNEMVSMASSELVGGAKAVNVGAAHQLGVGGAMNTTVGLASTEQVGQLKHFVVGDKFVVECGSGKLEIESNGKVTISGTSLEFSASGPVKINGSVVDLN